MEECEESWDFFLRRIVLEVSPEDSQQHEKKVMEPRKLVDKELVCKK